MVKRTRKPPVQPETRQDWLERLERRGESVRKIAATDEVDIRTVRKHVELARRELEVREARSLALRSAIQEHYRDLCGFAEKLTLQLHSERNTLPQLRTDRMWTALRQHLPRSVIWRKLDRWEELRSDMTRLNRQIEEPLEEQIDSRLERVAPPREPGLNKRIFNALANHVAEAARGQRDLSHFDFDRIPETSQPTIAKLVEDVLYDVANWERFKDIGPIWDELQRVNQVLDDELATITLRRVVPGRCRYCPV